MHVWLINPSHGSVTQSLPVLSRQGGGPGVVAGGEQQHKWHWCHGQQAGASAHQQELAPLSHTAQAEQGRAQPTLCPGEHCSSWGPHKARAQGTPIISHSLGHTQSPQLKPLAVPMAGLSSCTHSSTSSGWGGPGSPGV